MNRERNQPWQEAQPARQPAISQSNMESGLAGELGHIARQQPWLAFGAAIAAGYILGGGSTAGLRRTGFSTELDQEFDLLRTAAVAAVTGVVHRKFQNTISGLNAQGMPGIQAQGNSHIATSNRQESKQRTTAENSSWEEGGGRSSTGFDSPPITSSQLPNPQAEDTYQNEPYYPPGGPAGSITRE